MNDRVRGLVLSISDYKENDSILRVLTKEYGLLSFVSKGVKKIHSKNKVLPICLYEFEIDYKEGKTMFTIHHQKLLESFYEEKDLSLLAFKNVLLEATLKVMEHEENTLYDALLFTLQNTSKEDYYSAGSLYFAHILKELGIAPYVDGCVICNHSKVVAISNRDGGFLCKNHAILEECLEVMDLKRFRLIMKAGFENYALVKAQAINRTDFCRIVDFFIANSAISLKSYHFYLSVS